MDVFSELMSSIYHKRRGVKKLGSEKNTFWLAVVPSVLAYISLYKIYPNKVSLNEKNEAHDLHFDFVSRFGSSSGLQ